MHISKLAKFLSEAMFPQSFTCDICGIEVFEGNLCSDCLKTVRFNDGNTCPVCGRITVRNEICYECKAHAPLFKKAVSPFVYDGGVKILIAKFKNGESYLKEYFADIIWNKIALLPSPDCIVYIPMTKKAVRKRGYNQAQLIAQAVGKRSGLPVIENAVVKQKDSAEQKTLSFKERAENLSGCFKVDKRSEIIGKNVLLIDDVLTTGATAEAMCKVLLKAGVKSVTFATVASVEYKNEKNDSRVKI